MGCCIFAGSCWYDGKRRNVMKHILLLSQFFYPDKTGTGRVMGALFSALSQRGFAVDVVASRQEYGDMAGRILPIFEQYGKVRVFRCFRWFCAQESGFGRIFNYVMVFFCTFWTCLHHRLTREKDIIVSVSNPPIMPLLGLLLRRRGQRFIYILHDLYPDIAIAMGVVGERHLFSRVMFAVNRYVFKNADQVVVLGRDMKAYLEKAYQVPEGKMVIIPNWARDGIAYQAKPSGRIFRVLYTGNMGRFHDLKLAVEAFRTLPNAELIFVGEGASKAEVMARARGMQNVRFLPFLGETAYREMLITADAFLVSLEANLSGMAVPSKFYTYLAAGRPIIAISDMTTEMAMTIREKEVGFVVPHGDVRAFLAAVEFLRENEEAAHEMGKRAHRLYLAQYCQTEIVRMYASLFA
ncbi:MAG: glycosyltransferase family 4 protein [Negativicutes bacterium]